ncbi:hypothetical protein [Nitrosospira sp. Nsp11]|uniref:hypothetical protein n=1 Tax=Nitrosospira sp. Nsp11 TaxID=1855338 RepID=UPI001160487D|nr:hypothetical protein [Nitrosospira sp. Nsp11]
MLSTIGGFTYASEPLVSITTTPNTVELCPGKQAAQVLVTVQNKDAKPIRNICLRAFTSSSAKLDFVVVPVSHSHDEAPPNTGASEQGKCIGGVVLPELKPNSILSRLMSFNVTSYVPTSTAILWADYEGGDLSKDENEIATGSFSVTTSKLNPELFKVEAKANFASLYEGQDGNVLLMITNGTNNTIKLNASTEVQGNPLSTTVIPIEGSSTTVSKTMSTTDSSQIISTMASTTVPPHGGVVIPYKVTADKKVSPGKFFGLIQVDAQTDCGPSIHRVVSYEVTLGVFGESDLLRFLKVPTLLFLPGFLILTLWMLLWRFKVFGWRVSFLAKPTSTDEFIISGADTEFWLLAITFSLILFFASDTMAIGYTKPYNLEDIAKVWGASLVISLFLYVTLLGVDRWRVRRAAEKTARLTLTPNDDVLTVVAKMQARSWPRENCRPVRTKGGSAPVIEGFTLWEEKPEETIWVIPQIECVASPGALGDFDPSKNDLIVTELLRELREITTKKLALVQWGKKFGLNGPRLMNLTDLEASNGEMVVVRLA